MCIDDDALCCKAVELILKTSDRVGSVYGFSNPDDALSELPLLRPSLILTDLGFPHEGGVNFITKAKSMLPYVPIIAFTAHDGLSTICNVYRAGGDGYLLKTSSPEQILSAMNMALDEGGIPMTLKVARAMIAEALKNNASPATSLSARELGVLELVNSGLPYKEVASELGICLNTTHNHIRSIFTKLHVSNKTEALNIAKQRHIL